MKLIYVVVIFLWWAVLPAIGQETVSLNGDWMFSLAKNGQEVEKLENFYRPGFKTQGFKLVPVPSNWAVLGYEEPVYRGFKDDRASEGFYLHEFDTPEGWNNKRVLLHFGGVWSSAEVWLNGKYIGRHESGFTSFSFNVTGKLNATDKNTLAVRVKQTGRGYKFDVFDDWTLGGIYRDVTLESMPAKRWIDQVVTQTVFDSEYKDAKLKVKVMVGDKHKETLPGNYPSPGEAYSLRFTLTGKNREEVFSRTVQLPAHVSTCREVSKEFEVENPEHWTAETPYLYDFRVELLEQGEVIHSYSSRIGFRQISTAGGVFRINGQTVKLRGVNRHDEHPDVGRSTTREHWLQDIEMMKAANINYVRASHYAPAKGFIELCDELGMYVGNEVSMGGAGDLVYDPSYYDAALQRAYETVSRDLNNPSIIYWSVGNEDPFSAMHQVAVKLVKALDPTRPVLLPWRHEDWLPEEIDILAPHYWTANEYDRLAAQSDRPVISTEYTHAFGTDGFGGLEDRWKSLTRHPAGAGAAIWMWADQGIKTPSYNPDIKPNEQNNGDVYLRIDESGWDGIVDSYRHPTRDYWEVKAVYAQVYPITDKVDFIPGQDSVSITLQNDFDFTDLDKIRIDWTLWKEEEILDSASAYVQAAPHTRAALALPIGKLAKVKHDEICYVRMAFVNRDGEEINLRSVELCPQLKMERDTIPAGNISVEDGTRTTVKAEDVQYVFDTQTGQLVSAQKHGKNLIRNIRPVIWHQLDRSDVSIIGKKLIQTLPDFTHYVSSVKSWRVERWKNSVSICTEAEHVINEENRFTVAYHYEIDAKGNLTVRYKLEPNLKVPFLPVIGMRVQAVSGLEEIHWLGLGPYDAYPNKKFAAQLGFWGGKAGSNKVTGIKSVRRIEWAGNGSIRIYGDNYMEHDASSPDCINVLSEVLGRPEKGRKADEAISRLQLSEGKTFIGQFYIELGK